MSVYAMELAVKALEKYHYYIIDKGVADRALLDEGFAAFHALKMAIGSQVTKNHAWTKVEKDDSDYVLIGTLNLAGMEDYEYLESETDPLDHVIDALQEQYINDREAKRVPLLVFVGDLKKEAEQP